MRFEGFGDFQWIRASMSDCSSHKVLVQLHKNSFQLYKLFFFFLVWQRKLPSTFVLRTKEAWTLLTPQFVFHRRKNKTYRVGTTCGWVNLSFFYLLYLSYCFSTSRTDLRWPEWWPGSVWSLHNSASLSEPLIQTGWEGCRMSCLWSVEKKRVGQKGFPLKTHTYTQRLTHSQPHEIFIIYLLQ